MNFKIKDFSREARLLIGLFTLSLLIGYGVALLKAYEKTSFSPSRVTVSYRGDPDPEAMALPKTYEELLQNTHAHALSVPLVYFLLGGLFCFTGFSQRVKMANIFMLFGGFFIEFSSLWGLLYISSHFVWGTFIAHACSGTAYLFMSVGILSECAGFRVKE